MSSSEYSEHWAGQQRLGPPSPALSTIEEVSEPPSRRVSDPYVNYTAHSSPEPFEFDGRTSLDIDPTPSPTIRSGTFRVPSATPSPQGEFPEFPKLQPSVPERYHSETGPHRILERGHKHGSNRPYQGNATLIAGREVPGRRARWSANNAAGGDIWTYPHEVYLGRQVQDIARSTWARQVIDEVEDGLQLQEIDPQDMYKIMNHPNLVSIIDWDGFGEDGYGGEQEDVRREVAWEKCDAGTLNRSLLDYGRPLPESFVWHTLISLLRALQHLSYGQSEVFSIGDGGTVSNLIVDGWQPILHNQINPANIFYCEPVHIEGYKRTCYGTCKLGNFSNALVLRRPLWFWDRQFEQLILGHHSISPLELDRMNVARERHQYFDYDAPELSIYTSLELPPDSDSSRFLNSEKRSRGGTVGNASDIWSLGAVIVVMMTGGRKSIWDLLSWAYNDDYLRAYGVRGRVDLTARLIDEIDAVDEDGEQYFNDPIRDLLPDQYSEELRQMVSYMMDPRPQLRLEIHELLEQGLACYRRVRRQERAAGRESEGEWTLAETLDGEYAEDEDMLDDLDSGII